MAAQNPAPEPNGDDASFESVYARLEQAVARLEAGGLALEESIALYEAGMRLAIRCQELLEAAELRVTQIENELGAGSAARGGSELWEEEP
jgi:exodeoxyribonuclease VII small subunit